MPSQLIAATPAELTDHLFSRFHKPDSPGCAVGVSQDGKVVHQRGYGMANLELSVPISRDTMFYLGSTSKEYTAMAVLLLAGQGALKLDDPIRKWLPQLPSYMQPVTVRHLLEHSSGIRDYIGLWTLSAPPEDAALTDQQVWDIILRQKALNFRPGDEFLYSNSNYFLLAHILRPVAFRMLPDFARERIFAPLGLRGTLYYTDRFALLPHRATGYTMGKTGAYRINSTTLDVAGDGGVFTNIEDALKWIGVIAQPPQPYAAAVSQMLTRAVLNSGDTAEYGRGLMLKRHHGLDMVSHVGGLRGYRSELLWIPSKKLGVACLCNTSDADPGRLARSVADAWMGPVAEPAHPKVTPAELRRKTGVFRDRNSGDYLQIVYGGGRFLALFQGFQIDLWPETPMRFRAESPLSFEIEFEKIGDRDEPRFLRVESESHRRVDYERVTLDRRRAADLPSFEGDYYCEEAQSRMTVRIVDGMLNLEQHEEQIGVLEPMQPDRYRSATLNLHFHRDSSGKVYGFLLNTGRVRGLEYVRVKPGA
ncbi:MAG: beta-lactamase family protein [Bryobacterales bacterium]|nr:beta-lactamase family protein [Bryobacterales bacterium]